MNTVTQGLVWVEWGVIIYFLFVNSFYAVLLVSAAVEMVQHGRLVRGERRWRVLDSKVAPGVTMLAPAYNEAATITESVRALLSLYYPNLEIIVIDDGSRDETLQVLTREFDLSPINPVYQRRIDTRPIRALYRSRMHANLVVAAKENGGKADALNSGLNLATGELVCAMDADTLIEPEAMQRMVRPFLQGSEVLAAGGTIRVANGSVVRGGRVVLAHAPLRPIPGFQVIEYLRAFLLGRLGWNRLGGNLIISGAFGLFRRAAMIDIGGYAHDTVGEDMELVVRLRRHGYETGGPHRVEFIPDPVAWTEAPESLRVLGRQRDRWHRGLADVLWRHRGVTFNPRYGAMGMLVFPYFIFLELFAPVIEVVGLLGLGVALFIGVLDLRFAALFFLVAYGMGMVLSVASLVMEELSFRRYDRMRDRFVLLAWALFENIGYRQLTAWWRLRGLLKFFRGRREWGAMERRGFRRAGATTTPEQDIHARQPGTRTAPEAGR
jgi:cellulose synthase/poly-beta-1,6-N-acetylglucosamine synthase-like glycosyltransferase